MQPLINEPASSVWTPEAFDLKPGELAALRDIDRGAEWDNLGDCQEAPRARLFRLGLVYCHNGTWVTEAGHAVANA